MQFTCPEIACVGTLVGMRRDKHEPAGTTASRAPRVENDGANGGWVRGLPADVVGRPDPAIDYDAQSGCPRDVAGGTYVPNVTGAPAPAPAAGRTPFKLGK